MQPKTISDIFIEYGNYKWNDGFLFGYMSGVWIILCKKA